VSEVDDTPEEEGQFDAEGNYILEDTGESLQDFDAEKLVREAKASEAAREGPSEGLETGGAADDLRRENATLRDQYVRKLADFENFRKRNEREKADFFRYALTDLMRELLPALDNFERALSATDSGTEFRKGVELIYKQFADALQKNGLRVIAEENVPFDPQIHEAVMREETSSVPSHTVIELLQKGYFLHDRLLRPAMVKVAVGGPANSSDTAPLDT